MSCFTVQEFIDKNPKEYDNYLDDQLDFYPTLVVQASNVTNAANLEITFEVTYNVTFRGASTISLIEQDKSNFIDPVKEVAPYITIEEPLNVKDM